MRVGFLIPALLSMAVVPAVAGYRPVKTEKPLPPLLSRDELRSCIKEEAALNKLRDEMDKAHVEHDLKLADALDEAKALAEELRTLDKHNAAAIADFNRRSMNRDERVDALNKQAESMNEEQESARLKNVNYMKRCATRPFLKSDEDAVLKEMGRPPRPIDRKRPNAPAEDKEA